VQACLAGGRDKRVVVVEENRLLRGYVEARAGQGVDPGIGLTHLRLVGVDDLVYQVLEPVGLLFPLPGPDEAVAQDPGAVTRAQPAEVIDQRGVGGAEVLAPQVGHERRELPFVQAEAIPEGLVHVVQGDGADAAADPGLVHALVQFPGGQAEPGLPLPGDPEIGSDLQHAADIEHHRADRHDADLLTPGAAPG
jgi:hypothetical protein